jgi:hypothetical protein
VNLLPITNFDGSAICESVISFISSVPLNDDLENLHYGTDLYPFGHSRPAAAAVQTLQHQRQALIEIQHSILFKFLNLLINLLTYILMFFNAYPGYLLDHNFITTQQRHLRILQKVITWISAFVFLGLLILTF